MKTNLIKIGNSKGIRITSNIIKECEFNNEVEIKVVDKKIIIEAVKEPRSNWENSFKKMHKNKEDFLIAESNNVFDKDWEW
jgi:antitoxin MazE